MRLIKSFGPTLVAGLLFLGITGCEQEGPAERAGEQIDEAAEQAQEAVEEAGKETQQVIEEAGDKIEQKTDQ